MFPISTRATRTKVGEHVPLGENVFGRQRDIGRETMSARALPPRLGRPAAHYFKQPPCRLAVVLTGEIAHDGCDVIGLRNGW